MIYEFLAKSLPKETIQEHTDNLLVELYRLKELYPNINVNWELLKLSCLYHDLGKMNCKFQEKIMHGKSKTGDIPHGILSTTFIDTKKLRQIYTEDELKLLISSIYYHHDRTSLSEVDVSKIKEEINELKEIINNFTYDKIQLPSKLNFKEKYVSRFGSDDEKELLSKFVIIKGLLNKIDYAASAHIPIEIKNDFLEKSLENFMQDMKRDCIKFSKVEPKWNKLQEYMRENTDDNIVAIAETGMGKTEAGLLWIGNNKGFFTLPIRTAINAIYFRIKNKILNNDKIDEKLGLLHSETKGYYLQINDENKSNANDYNIFDLDEYFSKTRQLSLPLTICTIDQLFPFVFRYKGYESKLATLSYSKIVIDEIQMYGPELVGFLIKGLTMIQELGGKYAILTATFPEFLKTLMKENQLKFKMPLKPFVNENKIRHSVKWIKEEINSNFIIDKYHNNRILVICNTVKQCQKIYKELKSMLNIDEDEFFYTQMIDRNINMFHAKFINKDRKEKEKAILEFGELFDKNGQPNKKQGIWVTNMIAEASLDIDFDILITELSDVNSLFQRLGRCYRKRLWEKDGYNCYVFDGGDKECSGVGKIIDREIFNLSRENLRKYFENNLSTLSEKVKMDLVEQIYSTENVKNMKYYKTIREFIKNPELFLPGEKSSVEAQKLFRNINSKTIIPYPIYLDNEEEILELQTMLNSKNTMIEEKVKARECLKDFTLSVENHIVSKAIIKELIKIGRYDEISVIDCDYDSEMGLGDIKKSDKDKSEDIEYIW